MTLRQRREMTLFIRKRPAQMALDVLWTLFVRVWLKKTCPCDLAELWE